MNCETEKENQKGTKKSDKYNTLQCKRKSTDNFKCSTEHTMCVIIITDQCISEQVASLTPNPVRLKLKLFH